MIELSSSTALMIYLGMTVAILLGLWISSHYCTRRRSVMPLEKELTICEFCHYAYLDAGATTVTRCPRCSNFNKKKV